MLWNLSVISHWIFPQCFPKQALVFTCLHYKSFKNTVGKGEIAHNEQFLLYPQYFLLFRRTFCHFHHIQNCWLQALWVWKSLKFVVWERDKGIPSKKFMILNYWWFVLFFHINFSDIYCFNSVRCEKSKKPPLDLQEIFRDDIHSNHLINWNSAEKGETRCLFIKQSWPTTTTLIQEVAQFINWLGNINVISGKD